MNEDTTHSPLHVRAKRKTQVAGYEAGNMQFTYSFQEGSKWLAFHEPDYLPDLPWRLNHKFVNIRLAEGRFREIFEETRSKED